jgi:hypothetical protein
MMSDAKYEWSTLVLPTSPPFSRACASRATSNVKPPAAPPQPKIHVSDKGITYVVLLERLNLASMILLAGNITFNVELFNSTLRQLFFNLKISSKSASHFPLPLPSLLATSQSKLEQATEINKSAIGDQ